MDSQFFIIAIILALCGCMIDSLKIFRLDKAIHYSKLNIIPVRHEPKFLSFPVKIPVVLKHTMQLHESAKQLPDKKFKSILLLSYGSLSVLSFSLATFFGLLYFRSPLTTLGQAATYMFFGVHSMLLYSACSRERLEATTFRILIPTLILSELLNAIKVHAVMSMLSKAGHPATVIVSTEIAHVFLSVLASVSALRAGYELPNVLQLASKGFNSVSGLAKAYLVSAHSISLDTNSLLTPIVS